MRLSVGAVGVESGNFAYFDRRRRAIGPEHIMASGALPPGLPPIVIDGEPTGTAASSPTRRCST